MTTGIINVIVVIFILELITQINGQIWRPPRPDQAAVCHDENGNEYLHGQTIEQDCNTCTCLDSNWSCTEIACSDPCFSSPCQHDGLCVKKFDLYYECICSRGYSGIDCQIELPSDACYDGKDTLLNGETFKHDDCEQECKCDNGEVTCDFNGCPEPECQNPIYSPHYCCPICWPEKKPGFCPETSLSTVIGTCEETCRHDVDCEDINQKCCFNGCGMSCTDPQPEQTALCAESPCQNGATCIDILSFVVVCQCLPGFHGQYCEKEDGKACYHDGAWYRDGQTELDLEYCYECTCNDGFFECFDRCAEKPGECPDGHYYDFNSYGCFYDYDCPLNEKCCSGECLTPDPSGLSCIYNGIHLNNDESYHDTCHFCICQRGEVHCDDSRCVQDKPGTCPPAGDVGICIVECRRDMECPGIEKCCINGCGGGVCTNPLEASITSSCYFEGDWHEEGEIERNGHDCGACFCSNGTVLCRTPICPEVFCYQPTYVESECCPICIDYGTHPGECPAVTYTSPSTCISTCEHDYYCESDEKCCQTECGGKSCIKPISLDHRGMCPYLVYDTYFYYYYYQDQCQIDDHCPSNEKCCYDISGRKSCMESIPEDTVICSDYPCLNGGTCEQYWEPWTYICTCADGFTGSNCEEIDTVCHVSPNPCINGGSCTGFEGYPCDCPIGFTGEFCEDSCDNSICQNGGNCTGYDYQHCYCPFGYTGDYCETSLCNSNPCMNGGTCTGYDWYPCYCPYGYGGEHCDEENVCASEPCMNGGICLGNFDSTYFSEYTSSDYDDKDSLCLCLPGYGGTFCEQDLCDPNPCNNGGTCSGYDSYPCYCPVGFNGDYCEEESLCASQPCMNGGICVADYDYSYSWSFSYSFSSFWNSGPCSCPFGYSGEYCEIVSEICNSTVCYNGGFCTGYDFWPCFCPGGFTGNYCEEGLEYSWSWFGPDSSHFDTTGFPSYPTFPDSEDDHVDIPSYLTSDGSGDDDTESDGEDDRHKTPDPCIPNPCLNHGRCHLIGFYFPYVPYYCECAPGFVGDNCEEDVRCTDNYCLNGGICINSVYGSYCECPQYISGRFCEVVLACARRPCHNGGTCNHFYGDIFTCSCPPGVSGETCDVLHDDVCEYSPCVNFGSCTEFGGVADCSCVEGYTGKFCEIIIEDQTCPDGTRPDSCLFDPCQVASCPENALARCESNYCGCIAEFYDENGNIVKCHDCPENNEVTCVINPCEFVTCEANPRAICKVNYCGECEAVFYDLHGNLLNCESATVTCQYNEQTYYSSEQRDDEDACNTCTCTKLGEWDCTANECPGRVVVQMEFTLEYNYDDIIDDIENFKNDIISQLAKQYGIGENNFKDVQVRKGSIIVEFKLVNEDDIDSQEVANMMFEELSSGNVEFEYNDDTLAVRPESVKQPKVIENEPTDEDNHLAIIIVCVVVVTIIFVVVAVVGWMVTSRRAKKRDEDQTNLQAVNTVSQNNPYAQLDKDKLSGTVVYDNLGGATIQGSDNPTYIPS